VLYLSGVAGAPFTRAACMAGLARIRARHPETAIALVLFADAEVQRECEALGYPCYDDPDLAVRAIAAAASLAAARDRAPDPPPAPPPGMRPAAEGLGGEAAALAVLASAGIPALRPRLARSPAEAVAAWAAAGGPVAMKIASPDIAHKTEAGGVALGIDGAETVARTHAALLARVRAARPGARLEGVLVAPMVPEGLEMVLGASLDPVFGPVVMVGFGGILVELLQDVALGLAPLGPAEARAMIDGLRGRALLDGARGRPAVDVAALAEALARLSVFAAANADRIAAIDINPFVLRPEGGLAVDALIVPREA
jgi:acyl-CoA synthetase (NDP forming)